MILKSMTDFVLEQSKIGMEVQSITHQLRNRAEIFQKICNYAKFLKQPLTLGMFIPCDEEGNVLEEPLHYKSFIDYENDMDDDLPIAVLNICGEYHEAKKRILFEGFMLIHIHNKRYKQALVAKDKEGKGQFDIYDYETLEDLVFMDLTLTPNAIKQLGL